MKKRRFLRAPELRLLVSAICTLLLFSHANAQERLSKPGIYSGYSRMLYAEIVHNSQYLAMRDGIKLAATIYRPAVSGFMGRHDI
jgi:predicted acyl esterase